MQCSSAYALEFAQLILIKVVRFMGVCILAFTMTCGDLILPLCILEYIPSRHPFNPLGPSLKAHDFPKRRASSRTVSR